MNVRSIFRRSLPGLAALAGGGGKRNRSGENVAARNEAGFLEGFSGSDIRGIAARRGHTPLLVTDSFQLLDQIRSKAASAEGFGHFHVDVAVGPVVMEKNP